MKNEKWGAGPWDDEPDELEFMALGYKCEIKRQRNTGNLCGYIQIPSCHPWHGLDLMRDTDHEISVHGGVTHAGEDSKGRWSVGFDCAHLFDLIPGMDYSDADENTYRTIEFCKTECKALAIQARSAATRGKP